MKAHEVNFDGLVGPTHHYAGLSYGNIASMSHRDQISNPKEAALQGLAKMKLLWDLGVKQVALPPQERPDTETLRRLGFEGSDTRILELAAKQAPEILAACCSASSMWAANAATVTPSADAADGRVHFTPANLSYELHRSIEHETMGRVLKSIFYDKAFFVHHSALPSGGSLMDEGAANHTRLCEAYETRGIHLFVFGKYSLRPSVPGPKRFPARQTYEASSTIVRTHRLDPRNVIFAQQNPELIDAGVFHNDVICVGNENALLFHELAFVDTHRVMAELEKSFGGVSQKPLCLLKVNSRQISVEEAVRSYLFNSQLVRLPESGMALVAPVECQESATVSNFLKEMMEHHDHPIRQIRYVDLRQSMQNGGGPACLRLRVVLKEDELAHSHEGVYLDERLYTTLCQWVKKHYRDRLSPADLADPQLLTESHIALDELTQLLKLGSIYPFQLNR